MCLEKENFKQRKQAAQRPRRRSSSVSSVFTGLGRSWCGWSRANMKEVRSER